MRKCCANSLRCWAHLLGSVFGLSLEWSGLRVGEREMDSHLRSASVLWCIVFYMGEQIIPCIREKLKTRMSNLLVIEG